MSEPKIQTHARLDSIRVEQTHLGWTIVPQEFDGWRSRLLAFISIDAIPKLVHTQTNHLYVVIFGDTSKGGMLEALPSLAAFGLRFSVSPIVHPGGTGFVDTCIAIELLHPSDGMHVVQALTHDYDEALLMCTASSDLSMVDLQTCGAEPDAAQSLWRKYNPSFVIALQRGGNEVNIVPKVWNVMRVLGFSVDEHDARRAGL